MAATLALYLVGFVMAYLAYEMAMTPPKNTKSKIGWRIGIGICAIFGLGLTYYQYKDTQTQQTENDNRLGELRTNFNQSLDRQKKEFGEKFDKLMGKQTTLLDEYDNFRVQLLTNQLINPDLRERIIESNRKFEELDSGVLDITNWLKTIQNRLQDDRASAQIQNQKERQQRIEAAQSLWEKCSPYYDYATRTLEDLVHKTASTLGDKAVSNYRGMPASIDIDIGETNVAQIKFQNNSNWCFNVIIQPRDNACQLMTIRCDGGDLMMGPFFQINRFDTYLHTPNGETIKNFQPIVDSKTTIKAGLEGLIALEYAKSIATNK